jgi:hypothetical protein
MGRSLTGAWIEMIISSVMCLSLMVAPSRERGLKSQAGTADRRDEGRSLTGAWIEMAQVTSSAIWPLVAPSRERGLKYY